MFCSNCGKELSDKAVVCPQCGCLVDRQVSKVKGVVSLDDIMAKKMNFLKILLIISSSLLALSFMFAMWGIITPVVNIYFLANGQVYGYVLFDVVFVICSFIAVGIALATGITTFVFSLKKDINESLRLMSIFNFIFCIAMTGVIIPMAFCCW